MKQAIKIVFMGTPTFAAPSLEALASQHEVVAVVTAPDRPAGRGRQPKASVVKEKAIELGLQVLQPEKLKAVEFLEELNSFNADLFVVVAFRMLPEEVWSMPKMGCINLHASLLPDLRGAAPINWALVYGYKKTGVSTFFIEREIDTGKVILQKEVPIEANDTAGSLHDKLMALGPDVLLETVQLIASGNVTGQSQKEMITGSEKPAPKIFKSDGELDWTQEAEILLNKIRGLSPYPAAWTTLETESGQPTLKIFHAMISADAQLAPGAVQVVGTGKFLIGTGSLPLDILEVQLEGKKRMGTGQFLLGMRNKGPFKIV